MFLKSLKINTEEGDLIRGISFHQGLNLIVDNTPIVGGKETGNNVGKTTVLKLIDFCLGANGKGIYTDSEHRKSEYKLVKDYLIENKVIISLVLKEDLDQKDSQEILIERNLLKRKEKVQKINGVSKNDDEFEESLTSILFPGHYGKKPSFRQIISHNIRHTDLSLSNTLKTLNRYTKDDEYETLYLFLLGCEFEHGDTKQELRSQINIEEKFKSRLESEQTKSAYETALILLQSEIDELERKKSSFNLNPSFESDLDNLNKIKYQINLSTSEITKLELRKDLIIEAQKELKSSESSIDVKQLKQIYAQAKSLISGIQKTFEELNDFHNQMLKSKIRFIEKDLPSINSGLQKKRKHLGELLVREKELSKSITQKDSFDTLEELIIELTAKHKKKGEYENVIGQLSAVESKLTDLNNSLQEIDNDLFTDEANQKIKNQVNKFNKHFASVSNELYGEQYAIKVDPVTKKGKRLYEFRPFNVNISSGKKQGEISCFDIAYTLFADEENIPCFHFLLNDKKELMHGNQLQRIARLVSEKRIQFVASILKDKLPEELDKDEYVILKLSQKDKLFRIERKKSGG